jgi:hypothetical protein
LTESPRETVEGVEETDGGATHTTKEELTKSAVVLTEPKEQIMVEGNKAGAGKLAGVAESGGTFA